MIKTADWLPDLGRGTAGVAKPHRGVRARMVVAAGTREAVAGTAQSYTGQYFEPLLERATQTDPVPA